MRKVESIIECSRWDQVRKALNASGVDRITITSVSGIGQQSGPTITYRGAQRTIEQVPRLKLEMVVDDCQVDNVVDVIYENGQSRYPGDGESLVLELMSPAAIHKGGGIAAMSGWAS